MKPVLLVVAGPNGAGKTTEINAVRVALHVIEGGHTVPIEKIVSRYARSHANLPVAVRLSHRAYVYDNSIDDAPARLCVRWVDGEVRKRYGEPPRWVADAMAHLPLHADYEQVTS